MSSSKSGRLIIATVCLVVGLALAGLAVVSYQLLRPPGESVSATGAAKGERPVDERAAPQNAAVSSISTNSGQEAIAVSALPNVTQGSTAATRDSFRSSINPGADEAMRAAARPPQLTEQANLPTVATLSRLLEDGSVTAENRSSIDQAVQQAQHQATRELGDNWKQQFDLRNQLQTPGLDPRQSREIQFELARLMTEERGKTNDLDQQLRQRLETVLPPEQWQQLLPDGSASESTGGPRIATPID